LSSSFLATPPTFTLIAETSGGPPTHHFWIRDNHVLQSTTLSVNGNNSAAYEQSLYHSTLTVTGRQPGQYQFLTYNRATTLNKTSQVITIGGTLLLQ